jgi:hypothetical protein
MRIAVDLDRRLETTWRAGSIVLRLFTSSIPIMRPVPRTSPMSSYFLCIFLSLPVIIASMCAAR